MGIAIGWLLVFGACFIDRFGGGIRSAPRDALIASSAEEKNHGNAFGLEGAGDNLIAFIGPLIAVVLLFMWVINIRSVFYLAMFHLKEGKRYRLHMRNATDDIHPMHLHRHSFERTKIGGKSTSGIIKDVVMPGGFQEIDIDFTADNPGLTLFHCHMQLHMDFGFMAFFDYV